MAQPNPSTRERRPKWSAGRHGGGRGVRATTVTRTRLAIAGAIAVLAVSCTSATPTTPPHASSPTAGTTPPPTSPPSAPALPMLPPDGAAEPGTYLAEYAGYRYTLNMPDAGWTSAVAENGVAISTDGPAYEWSASLIIWGEVGPGTALYERACQWAGTSVTPGPTVGDLADALAGLDDFETSGPMDVMVGGHVGKRVQLTVPDDVNFSDCQEGEYRSMDGRNYQEPGQVDDIRVVDVDGKRIYLFATYQPGTPAGTRMGIDQIVDSMVIDQT